MNDNRPLLEVQNLKKYFKTKRGMLHAVDDVTFTIGKGKTLGVVGESGCGKSTLLKLIQGFYPVENGKIKIVIKVGIYLDEKRYGKTNDHGCGFAIKSEDLLCLYDKININ